MTSVIVVASLILAILLITLVGIPVMQQRRLLRTRAHFAGRLLAAQDEQRAAFARELHDDAVQQLVALKHDLRGMDLTLGVDVFGRLDRLVRELRGLAHEIHPSAVDHVGLQDALRDLGEGFEERSGIHVEWCDLLESDHLNHAERLALYRVTQEALGNVWKHAGVNRVQIGLRSVGGRIELSISDTGPGFSRSEAASGTGIGLTSMEERLSLLGGAFKIDTSPGVGTRVNASLPARREGK